MAALLRSLNRDTGELEPVGVVIDGEYVGDDRFADLFADLDLSAPEAEEALEREFDGTYVNVEVVDDADVDPSAFRS